MRAYMCMVALALCLVATTLAIDDIARDVEESLVGASPGRSQAIIQEALKEVREEYKKTKGKLQALQRSLAGRKAAPAKKKGKRAVVPPFPDTKSWKLSEYDCEPLQMQKSDLHMSWTVSRLPISKRVFGLQSTLGKPCKCAPNPSYACATCKEIRIDVSNVAIYNKPSIRRRRVYGIINRPDTCTSCKQPDDPSMQAGHAGYVLAPVYLNAKAGACLPFTKSPEIRCGTHNANRQSSESDANVACTMTILAMNYLKIWLMPSPMQAFYKKVRGRSSLALALCKVVKRTSCGAVPCKEKKAKGCSKCVVTKEVTCHMVCQPGYEEEEESQTSLLGEPSSTYGSRKLLTDVDWGRKKGLISKPGRLATQEATATKAGLKSPNPKRGAMNGPSSETDGEDYDKKGPQRRRRRRTMNSENEKDSDKAQKEQENGADAGSIPYKTPHGKDVDCFRGLCKGKYGGDSCKEVARMI